MTQDEELKIIAHARNYYDKFDPSLTVFMVRDLQIVKDADLTDLAFALCQENAHRNDVTGFFELLDKYIKENVK